MTPEDYKILKEKAELWDSLSPTLRTQFVAKFPYSETLISKELSKKLNLDDSWWRVSTDDICTKTIENTSNASSHIGLLEQESKEMVEIRNFDKNIEK